MKHGLIIVVLFTTGILIGLGYSSTKAADVEIILGTSSAFNVVRGTDVSSGTKLYVGSSTVSIGTTTQNAMFYVAGSSTSGNDASLRIRNSSGTDTLSVRNDGAILIGTNTSTLNSALYVGSATSGSLGTITAGFLSMGTISANASLHGTTTVRFLADIFANGTITASKFSGDGSSLTGITATSLGSTSSINTTGTINVGSTTVSVLTTTGSATVTGTLTAANNTFTVNGNTGSMTASSITVSTGTLTVASGAFKVDETGSMTAARVTASSMTVTTGTLTAANGAFKVDETGSMTARSITVSTGTLTAGQGAFKVDETGSMTAARIVSTGDLTTAGGLFVVGTAGSLTAKTITSTGSITLSGSGIGSYSGISIGTNTPPSLSLLTIVGSNTASYGTTTPEVALVTIVGSDTSSSYASLRIIPGASSSGTFTAMYVRNDGAILVGTSTLPSLLEGTSTVNVNTPSLASGSATVYIRGNLYVTGSVSANLMIATTMSKGAGSFLIPHPDPEKTGWMLRHCFVESPTRGDNLYRFSVEILSEGSETLIELETPK